MHTISRRLALLALGALTLFGTTACGNDDEPSGPGRGITGTYDLRTVNGQNLPATVYEGNDFGFQYKVEVTAGRITLNSNNTFTDLTAIRQTVNNGTPETDTVTVNGTYTRNANTLTLTVPAEDETYTLAIQGDGSLVQTDELGGIQVTARYVKQ